MKYHAMNVTLRLRGATCVQRRADHASTSTAQLRPHWASQFPPWLVTLSKCRTWLSCDEGMHSHSDQRLACWFVGGWLCDTRARWCDSGSGRFTALPGQPLTLRGRLMGAAMICGIDHTDGRARCWRYGLKGRRRTLPPGLSIRRLQTACETGVTLDCCRNRVRKHVSISAHTGPTCRFRGPDGNVELDWSVHNPDM